MIVKSIIKRVGGSEVTLDGQTYRFKPSADEPRGDHVCEVADERHAAILLAIKDGYCDPDAIEDTPEVVSINGTDDLDETSEFTVTLKHEDGDEVIDLAKEDKAFLIKLMRSQNIPEPAGSKKKSDLIEAIITALNERA
jgi:hypothetical protein